MNEQDPSNVMNETNHIVEPTVLEEREAAIPQTTEEWKNDPIHDNLEAEGDEEDKEDVYDDEVCEDCDELIDDCTCEEDEDEDEDEPMNDDHSEIY